MRRAQASERLDKLEDALRGKGGPIPMAWLLLCMCICTSNNNHTPHTDYKKVMELEPGNRAARAKIPGLERVCQERMEKLKEETLGKKERAVVCGIGSAPHIAPLMQPTPPPPHTGKLKDLGNSMLSNFGLSLDNFKMQQDPNTGSYSISFQR